MNTSTMTVVFQVKDLDAVKQLYEAHKNGTLICGMIPEIISWGDQLTTPSEIIDGLIEIDPDFLNKKELSELCDIAETHRKTGG